MIFVLIMSVRLALDIIILALKNVLKHVSLSREPKRVEVNGSQMAKIKYISLMT